MAKFVQRLGAAVQWGPMTANGDIGVGDQSSCAFVANTTNTSTTLTVTSVSQGALVPGMEVSGAGITAGTTISSQSSGTPGGAGAYVLSGAATATATGVEMTAVGYEPGYRVGRAQSLSVQVNGTFGTSGALQIQGSNDGTNWYQLADLGGTAISFTAAGYKGIRDFPVWIRPAITAGSGAISLTASLHPRQP